MITIGFLEHLGEFLKQEIDREYISQESAEALIKAFCAQCVPDDTDGNVRRIIFTNM